MFRGDILPFFCALILLSFFAATCRGSASGVSSFFWLKPGTQARYAFTTDIFFDDHGVGYPFRGNYSWSCLSLNVSHAVLNVEVNLELFKMPNWTTPAHVMYEGMEFANKAKAGDLSFIKRIPMDQVVGRIIIEDNPESTPGVYVPSPILISKKVTVTVDLDTMMMTDDHGQLCGKWILWIDPLDYPLEQSTQETFVTNWLNRTLDVNISYHTSLYQPRDTIFGRVNKAFVAAHQAPIEDDFLSQHGLGAMFITYLYEPRTGIYLMTEASSFLDDFLTQELGVVVNIAGIEDSTKLMEFAFVGDLDSNWLVNISDVAIVAKAFGTRPADSQWNPLADVNDDRAVNIMDISIVAKAFGTHYIIPE